MADKAETQKRTEVIKILESAEGKKKLSEITECAMSTVDRLKVMRRIEPERLTRPITV